MKSQKLKDGLCCGTCSPAVQPRLNHQLMIRRPCLRTADDMKLAPSATFSIQMREGK